MVTQKYEQWRQYYATNNLPFQPDLDAFDGYLTFGTGGIRGLMGIGTNRLNVPIIRRVTLGLAGYLNRLTEHPIVAVSYDTRNHSREFAEAAVALLATYGIRTYLATEPAPTPELSFATRYYHATAGIMITASHNPATYNGYKIYDNNGCQLVPELSAQIAQSISNVEDELSIKTMSFSTALAKGMVSAWTPALSVAYLKNVGGILKQPTIDIRHGNELSIVYTPLHGTGLKLLKTAYTRYGFSNLAIVKEQTICDGRFNTVKIPNPEHPAAFKLAVDLAKQRNADLAIATDPDADRLGVFVKKNKEYCPLNGNQLALIFFDYLLRKIPDSMLRGRYVVKTVVTSDLIARMAADHGITCVETLTGFKYIGNAIQKRENQNSHFMFGCEESFGYLFSGFVRDKDAVQAALMVAEIALDAKRRGMTLFDLLKNIETKYGNEYTELLSVDLANQRELPQLLSKFQHIDWHNAGVTVSEYRDYSDGLTLNGDRLPKANVFQVLLSEGAKVTCRPSGTEPICKFYIDANSQDLKARLINQIETIGGGRID
ncbi:phospho-sugar mutase [Lapidilactobacillus luobeiensis]|uniref:phospho-sugar mutase n=1 Tax=Lapidilactobacillus luobeiensis TaxID=2950371 RepID=UPI0021C3FD24|nr:phospho-sugar mutase [Lapidilactobacillus luobeiensis]